MAGSRGSEISTKMEPAVGIDTTLRAIAEGLGYGARGEESFESIAGTLAGH